MMTTFVYDDSFDGLLTAIFDIYDRRVESAKIIPEAQYQPDAFSQAIEVFTDEEKSGRVWNGLCKKLTAQAQSDLYSVYLSELPGFENIILDFVQHVFKSKESIETNYTLDSVLQVAQIGRKLFREKHRFEAFVRFQKTAEGTFYASIDPEYNVLPLIIAHFKRRFADQEWIIYDVRRRYGIHFDKTEVQQITFEFADDFKKGVLSSEAFENNESFYQLLWQDYFKHTNIPARKNMKLHRRHVPMRYWKYLVEKRVN